MHLQENTLGSRSHDPLHHVNYAATNFEVGTSNCLAGNTFTRNVTDGRTHTRTGGQTDDGPTLVRN